MKILVPTDFSKLSRIAVTYAAKLAKKLNAEIILLNVLYIGGPGRSQTLVKTQDILRVMHETAIMNLEKLVKEIRISVGSRLKISYDIAEGYPMHQVIEDFVENNNMDMIVMGTKGASGLKRVFMGSTAAAVISNSKLPVIAVPEHARFDRIKNIVYASDLKALVKEARVITLLAEAFGATMHILHIVHPDEHKPSIRKIKAELERKIDYPKIWVHIIESDDYIEALDDFIADSNADLLAMFTHKLSLFERMFNTSTTRKMAFHSWVPLLAFDKSAVLKSRELTEHAAFS